MKITITTLFCATLASLAYAEGNARSLTVGEGFVDPLGFHDATPTFSWKLPEGGGKGSVLGKGKGQGKQGKGQSTSLSQPFFFEKVSDMEGASPLKSGFFRCEVSVRSDANGELDFYE